MWWGNSSEGISMTFFGLCKQIPCQDVADKSWQCRVHTRTTETRPEQPRALNNKLTLSEPSPGRPAQKKEKGKTTHQGHRPQTHNATRQTTKATQLNKAHTPTTAHTATTKKPCKNNHRAPLHKHPATVKSQAKPQRRHLHQPARFVYSNPCILHDLAIALAKCLV